MLSADDLTSSNKHHQLAIGNMPIRYHDSTSRTDTYNKKIAAIFLISQNKLRYWISLPHTPITQY